jgi:hypothetical protein
MNMDATALPTLLLGGDATGSPQAQASWVKGLTLPSVRGLVGGGRCVCRPTATSRPRSMWPPN